MKTNPIFLRPLASASAGASTALPSAIVCVPADNKDNKSFPTGKIYTLLCLLIYLGIWWGLGNGVVAQTTFGPQQVISTATLNTSSVFAADLDGDGDIDVLSASQMDNKIAWYENDGMGNFGPMQVITTTATDTWSVYAADIDNDGDIDVLAACYGGVKVIWFENDGAGNFGPEKIISNATIGAYSVFAADIDGDGDLDVLSASGWDDKIAWYENDGAGNFGAQQIISTATSGAIAVYAADLDGDGDIDVLSASVSDNKLAWYENDGAGNFGAQQIITTAADGMYAVYAADLDGDGDIDVLSASSNDDKIAWYENDGAGNFDAQQIITTAAYYARSVHAVDLDSDGDVDVLSASFLDNKIAWYENDGLGNFGAQQIITTTAYGARSVYAADLDGDGDIDVLSASTWDNKVAWYENILSLNVWASVDNLPCINASNGSVLVQISGGEVNIVPPYTYTWVSDAGTSGSGTAVTEVFTINNLAAGTYSISVTNTIGSTATSSTSLNPIPGSVFEVNSITSVNTGNNSPIGIIQLTIEGSTAPFTVWWSGSTNGSFSSDNPVFTLNNLVAGSYNITITDAEGKQVSQTVLLLDETTSQATCNTPLDIVILNDVSGSVDAVEYADSKQFFVDFINALNIGLADTQSRAAIIEWSGNAQQQIRIPITGNLTTLQSYVTYSRAFNGDTNANEALAFGHNYLQNAARPEAIKILILSTDGYFGQISGSLVALAETYKAQGYIIVTIAFDAAFVDGSAHNLLTQTASIPLLAPGALAYSQLTPNLANNIVSLYVCPSDPGSSNTRYFYRDGAIDITGYTVEGFCPNPTGITLHYTVTAQQQLSLPAGTPIAFYNNNPALFGSAPRLSTFIPCAIPAGSSETFSTSLPINSPAQVFAVLNDNGSQSPPISFPITPIAEHVYVNNTDNIAVCTILLLPNAFSPNADGENDLFRATYNFPVTHFYLAVYNRWGQQVFETTDIATGWNGMVNQQPAPVGVYVWYLLYRFPTQTKDSLISGNVTLIR